MPSAVRRFGALWGVLGIVGLLLWAIVRLTPYAYEALGSELKLWQWAVLLIWTAWMIVTEGYDGFQQRIAPRVANRAMLLYRNGDWLGVVFAPLYCFGYFRAPKRQLIVSYGVLLAIIAAVLVVHQLDQPWRGIIDCGVIAGLLYGIGTIVVSSVRTYRSYIAQSR